MNQGTDLLSPPNLFEGPSLIERRFWVFDMDGTLTFAAHDFDGFKRQHGLPVDRDILSALAEESPERQEQVHAAIRVWEAGIADRARAADDAWGLLHALRERGARLGILTRNSKEGAQRTLTAAGLAPFFPDEADILGRDCCPHKPAPDGILRLLRRWGGSPDQAVMVGDYLFDVMAGRAAGVATVLIAREGEDIPASWGPYIDVAVRRLDALVSPA
jgi:HAD superfamily hydrolase (TIGR01549 family)